MGTSAVAARSTVMDKPAIKPAWMLGFLAAMAIFAFAFLTLGAEVGDGIARRIDAAILIALRVPGHLETPRGPHWLRESVIDLSSLGSPTVLTLVVLLACGYLVSQRRPYLALLALSVIGSGTLAANLLKNWFDRARPDVVPHLVPAYSLSFPSGHAADSAIVYLTLAMLITHTETRQPTRIFLFSSAIVLTVMIGLTRLYLGVHWPSDVLAGWIFGAGWALIGRVAIMIFQRAKPRRATGEGQSVEEPSGQV